MRAALAGAVLGGALAAGPAFGQATSSRPVAELPMIEIVGRADPLIGTAESAAQGAVGAKELAERPIFRQGEVLETVPGVVITQHSGPGKANQYFLRGFNLDHGTDFSTTLDGMPLNLPSHAHGQGYTDLNFIMTELIKTISYEKGPYYADKGDFSSAGSADIRLKNYLPGPEVDLSAGSYGYARGLFAGSSSLPAGSLLYAGEVAHEDGPWTRPDSYNKENALLRFSGGNFSVMATAYHGKWNSTDQIAQRAVDEGRIGRFGSLDPTDGGRSQRYTLQGEWHRDSGSARDKVLAYTYYYDLDLFSNFTYFLEDPINGDQFEQQDKREVSGLKASREWDHRLGGLDMTETAGLQVRNDIISNGLYHTQARVRLSTTRQDDIVETSIAPYFENRVRLSDKVRSVIGARADAYDMRVNSDAPANSGNRDRTLLSPKASLVFGPWGETEYYINGGFGFHSNDARGTVTTLDPKTGLPVTPVTPLVRTRGAEVGARTTVLPGLQSTVALWLLDTDSELVFDADEGSPTPNRPSRRYGVEWANYWNAAPWLSLDLDAAFSRARFTEDSPAGDYIPDSLRTMLSAGVALHDLVGWSGEARVRYFGPRPLIEDDSVESKSSTLVTLRATREVGRGLTLGLELFNLFNESAGDIDYSYASRLPGEPAGGVNDIHFHPAEPRELRVSLTAKF